MTEADRRGLEVADLDVENHPESKLPALGWSMGELSASLGSHGRFLLHISALYS